MKTKLILLLIACLFYPVGASSGAYVVTQSVATTSEDDEYVRDSEWLTMPTIATTDQELNGLVAVYDTVNNYIAFSCAGAYTVDWGDGSSTENFASGVVAEHNFDYDDLSGTTTHSTEGYRQAIVQVTMQTSETLTAIDLDEKHSDVGNERWQLNWMDIEIAGSSITSFSIQSNEAPALMLKEFSMLSNSVTSFNNMFLDCFSLQSIPLLDTSSGTDFSYMFRYCVSLATVPLLDTSSGTNFSYMFRDCASLTTVPLLDTSSGTNFSNMFSYCYSLQSIPLLDTSSGTNFSNMFSYCYSLQTTPLLDTSSGTNFNNMFAYCASLTTVPLLDTSSGTYFSYMFAYCSSLQTTPLLDTSSGTNFGLMFRDCFSLQTIPLFDTSSGTNFSSMFYGCSSLQAIPLLDTSSGTNLNDIFTSCSSLQIGATSSPSVSITYPASYLTRGALVDIFDNLATATATITITGNVGVADLTSTDRLIATNKGWTIVD